MTLTGTPVLAGEVGPARPDWHDRSLCGPFYAETGFDAWHGPDEDELAKAMAEIDNPTPTRQMKAARELRQDYRSVARKVCRGCPVKAECLQFAMDNEMPGMRSGIWGGLTEAQRSHLATKVAAKAA